MLFAVEDLPFVPTIEIVLSERIDNSVSEKNCLGNLNFYYHDYLLLLLDSFLN